MNEMICRYCQEEFIYFRGKPGYIDSCPDCSTDIELFVAEEGTGDDGTVESMTRDPRAIAYLRDRELLF